MSKYLEIHDLSRVLEKSAGNVVLVHGFFDILHRGHINLFLEAKKHGDILVVGLGHDDNAKILKGKDRPFNDFESRLVVLTQVEPVDYIFQIPSISEVENIPSFYVDLYKKISPHIVATNIKAGKHGKYKKRDAEKLGIKFVDVGNVYKNSTTKYLEKMR